MSIIMKGTQVAAAMKKKIEKEILVLGEKNISPHLGIVRVGARPDDLAYERGIKKTMDSLGIRCSVFAFSKDINQEILEEKFENINENSDIHGLMLFRPLPKHLDENPLGELINPYKDVDCMSPINIAKLFSGDGLGYAPCTPEAVMELLDFYNIDITSKNVTVIGRSMVAGKPLSMLFLKKNATVTICHSKTQNLEKVCHDAEILVTAVGKAKVVNKLYIRENAIVVDVGINMDHDGNLCGDVDFQSVVEKTSYITPVPGGVGSVTSLILARHVVCGAKYLNSIT